MSNLYFGSLIKTVITQRLTQTVFKMKTKGELS